MKNGKILQTGKTEELVKQMDGKVFQGLVAAHELGKWEKKIRIINLRNEEDGMVSIRFLGNPDEVPRATAQQPRLEDLYLQLFGREAAEDRRKHK